MRVGVLAMIQHSMFSSGLANTSLAIAELMRELGHEVELIQTTADAATWWDDCKTLAPHWKIVHAAEATGYDLLFEIGRLTISAEKRARMTARSIWVIRQGFLLQELETCLFPTTLTPKREFQGMSEVWLMDALAAAEPTAIQTIELLTRLPVRIVPYLWTPSVAMTHITESKLPSWLDTTVVELKKNRGEHALPPWTVHIAETNTTNASSSVMPIIILREAKRRGFSVGRWRMHNTDVIAGSKFFLENTVKHCTDEAVGLSGDFVGRQRCVEWLHEPMSCVLSHLRFSTVRPMLFDLAWAGIPLVHNSTTLRDIGYGLEKCYYPNNNVSDACNAIRSMEADLVTLQGIFAPGATNEIRKGLLARFSPLSAAVKAGWSQYLGGVGAAAVTAVAPVPVVPAVAVVAPVPAVAPVAVAVPVTVVEAPAAVAPVEPPAAPAAPAAEVLRVGFSDMWADFNPAYNFFTLMLSAAGAKLSPPVQVIGGPATPTDSVVIFGPFGNAWRALPATQPKIHFTGENTAPVAEADLNLGFGHFDMTDESYLRFPLWILEIDWFGANPEAIVNPKPIPLERCTKVYPEELERKKKFCSFIVSNPNNLLRNAAYLWLNEYKPIDSAGRVYNTMGPCISAGAGGGGGELKKFEFLKDYKFSLTYENNSARGYTTEKYLHAKAAGCIPIYWGDPAFERDFSTAGCIDARNVKSPEELIDLVRQVDENDAEWHKRFSVPALDSYRVAWVQRTMAEFARRIFGLGGFKPNSFPTVIGDEAVVPPAAVATAVAAPAAVATAVAAPAAATDAAAFEIPIMVTCANRKYLPSLQHWLVAVSTQQRVSETLTAHVFLSSDIPADTLATLKDNFPFATFETLPDTQPPTGAFADFWDPQHFGWKVWILNEMASRPALFGRMVFYTDAGSFLCRWPKEWMMKAQATGLCFLEDPREENRRWCSPEFCAVLKPTESELAAQQRLGGLVILRSGGSASAFFREAMDLARNRAVLVGPKWAGVGPDKKPFGHRHDQSIFSILSLRHGAATCPLDTVYCDSSLRKTFASGRAIYVHRGNFQVSRQFTDGIDEAYVINLDRRADRLERLWSNSPELQGRVERWPAVEGRSLKLTPAIQRLLAPNDFFWKKAVAGCALSHLGLWWKLANDHSDIKNYLILEDDVKFRRGWEQEWKDAVEAGNVPDDYDIIYLGGVLPPNRSGYEGYGKERVNESFARIKENTRWGQKSPTRYFHFCAYSYILSRKGVEKVFELMDAAGGYWTSADHILCNPVDVLKSYVLEPMVAGCYQDDDPAYANSQFNDFSRVDGFDSDLWNNDERFTDDEIKAATVGGLEINIVQVLKDVRGEAAAAATATATTAAPKPLTVQAAPSKPFTPLPKRFVCLDKHALDIKQLHECKWLLDLFDNPSVFPIERIHPTAPPPSDCPVVILQKPHIEVLHDMLERWDSFGAKFYVLHLSDEHMSDPLDTYELESCVKVLRFYQRPGIPCPEKVTTIPLGYHWTLHEGPKNSLTLTPRLPFRTLTWSFAGTDWNNRKALLEPLSRITPSIATFQPDWNHQSSVPQSQYISTLLDTVFVPCPEGMNPETFRFYEALECGCIPLIVRTEKNEDWIDWITEHIQVLPVDSWADAACLVEQLMGSKPMLEAYRGRVLTSWMDWKLRLRGEVGQWLA